MAAVLLFGDMLTQWRVGFSGVIGLDYNSLPVVMRIRGIDLDGGSELFTALQIMERAAIERLHGN